MVNFDNSLIPFAAGVAVGYIAFTLINKIDEEEVIFTDTEEEEYASYPGFSDWQYPFTYSDTYIDPTAAKCPRFYARQKRCFVPKGFTKTMCVARCKLTTRSAATCKKLFGIKYCQPYRCGGGTMMKKLRVKNPKTGRIITVGNYCKNMGIR